MDGVLDGKLGRRDGGGGTAYGAVGVARRCGTAMGRIGVDGGNWS